MSRPPAFQLYADDFLGGTADMSAEEVGAYIRLLCHQWNKGGLPNDPDRLAKMAGLMAAPSLGYVIAKFPPCADGQLRNERLERVRAESEAYSKKQSENGKKGAKTRWENGGANGGAIATPMANVCPNDDSPSPSPSPKDNKKRFKEPSIEEVKVRCAEIGLPESEAERFWNYHAAKGWVVGNQPMKSWVAALNTWKLNGQKFNQGSQGSWKTKPAPTKDSGEFCPGWQEKQTKDMTPRELVAYCGGL